MLTWVVVVVEKERDGVKQIHIRLPLDRVRVTPARSSTERFLEHGARSVTPYILRAYIRSKKQKQKLQHSVLRNL